MKDVIERLKKLEGEMMDDSEFNPEIYHDVMSGDYDLACKIGGHEATISTWVADVRMMINDLESMK